MNEYRVIDPATGEAGQPYPQVSDEVLVGLIGAVHETYRTWGRNSSISERAGLLRNVAAHYRQNRQRLAEIIVKEIGKPLTQALGEVDFTADIYTYYADNADDFLAEEHLRLNSGTGDAVLRKEPVGALLGIMPWNYPYYQVARFAAPNLLLGNTILLKHAPQCPESAAAIEQLFQNAGYPAGAYVNVYASNEQIALVIADPRVQGVSLTGSERAGSAVAETAGRHLKKVVLELGGSDPFIVLSTHDMDAVVACAVAARLENNGQACNAAKRFVIVDELFNDFTQRFTAALALVAPADPGDVDTELGPISSRQAADRLQDQVDQAVRHGAQILAGGQRSGTFFPPTVLSSISPTNPAYTEEFFGPVASLYRVRDEAEAVEVANDSPYGLGSYIFTTDPSQARRVARELEAGMVFINGVGAEAPELPFGGVKRSGFGRELGRYGIDEFANKKLIRTLS